MFGSILTEANDKLNELITTQRLLFFILILLLAYLFGKLLARLVITIAQFVAVRIDSDRNKEERIIKQRRVETYFSVAMALLRAMIVVAIVYYAIQVVSPEGSKALATVGAGTVFVIIAGATISPLLRDFSTGAIMLAERWYSVGDFVRIIPFGDDVTGVVENVTLRSTTLRAINGEVIRLHNQTIQGVKVTSRGKRILAVDVFVHDLEQGESLIEGVIKTLPVSPTMLVSPLEIEEHEQLAENLWRITLYGQTSPGREWLIEDFIKEALLDADEDEGKKKIIAYGPLVRYADPIAEKHFQRAVHIKKNK